MFGLGNKTYEHFNAMGKYCDKRLAELGAKRVYEAGVGDDDGKSVRCRFLVCQANYNVFIEVWKKISCFGAKDFGQLCVSFSISEHQLVKKSSRSKRRDRWSIPV